MGWDEDPARARGRRRARRRRARGLARGGARATRRSRSSPCRSRRCRAPCASVLESAPAGCTVTDVGSTKESVCAAAAGDPRFVGGHPICGAETRGPARASAELFDGATWFLTPLAATEPARYRAIHALVASLGARPVAIDPAAHDRLVAVTSHLPHALANVLLNQAGASRVEGHEPLAAAGGSLRDMTRIAGANPRIWVDIFLDNRAALASVARRAPPARRAARGRARGGRRRVPRALDRRGEPATAAECSRPRTRTPAALHRLRVHVPDRPGVLAGIFQALGAERINVADFDLEHLSHDRGGTLTILVTGEEDAALAAAMLEAQGYGVVIAPVVEDA